MSYDLPPGPPPSEPPTGSPETLDSRGGAPIPASKDGSGGRRTAFIAAGAAIGAVGVAGLAWAAWSFFATGAQPSEALPDSTLAYASIDLDPSGGQKIEALRTLRKFPAFKDQVGLKADDDVREWIFDKIQGSTSGCEGLDYGDDIEPWLGDRFAVAAVDTGAEQPAPIFVVQVSDEDAADAGLKKLRACGGDTQTGAWAISDGWALIGESQKIVDRVADDAADTSLADDDDFQHWTDAAGDGGIVSMYAAPDAGKALADNLAGDLESLGGLGGDVSAAPDDMTAALKDFKGAAATVRFDDGGLELEMAADPAATGKSLTAGDAGAKAVSTLPEGTAAALGVSFADGWLTDLVDQVAKASGQSADDLLSEAGDTLGLDLPDDAETLVGDSLALAVDSDFDPSSLLSSPESGDSAGATGVGVKVIGDADGIEGVLDKLRTAAAGADGGVLDSDAKGDAVAIGPDADYRTALLEDGGLGGSDTFQRVVEHADEAAAVLFVDFGAGDDWLASLAGDDAEARDNLKPLDALGLSAWVSDDTAHAVLKVTTD